jgi:hypothetical protein
MTPIFGASISDAEICSTLAGKLNLDDGGSKNMITLSAEHSLVTGNRQRL